MIKQVFYNGKTLHKEPCAPASNLELGREYEVVGIFALGFQTNYRIKGLQGLYNSEWFEESDKQFEKNYIGIGLDVPKVGSRYRCLIIDNDIELSSHVTKTVQKIKEIDNYLFKLTCNDGINYIIQLRS